MRALGLLLLPVLGLLVSSQSSCSVDEAISEKIREGTSSLSEDPHTHPRGLCGPGQPGPSCVPLLTKPHATTTSAHPRSQPRQLQIPPQAHPTRHLKLGR